MTDHQTRAIMYLLNGNVNAITAMCDESSFADIADDQIKAVCSQMLDTYLYLAKRLKEGKQ